MGNKALWERYKKFLCVSPSIGLYLDISRLNFHDIYLDDMEPKMQLAYKAMDALEAGAIANPDEQRMVGHYWLRSPELAPSIGIQNDIEDTLQNIKAFTFSVHAGKIMPRKRSRFTRILSIGIGGSALGPQFIAEALSSPSDKMKASFLDNTDPEGIDRVLTDIGEDLDDTLVIVISKSGGTVETRNGMLEVAAAYRKAKLSFERHAVAVTGVGSKLYEIAKKDGWLSKFPMWDWVGGRTSIMSAVGLLPAALQGIDIDRLLRGASHCDEATRNKNTRSNPAALLALAWYHATCGRGRKDMVILPYKDRLQLFAKYLQQLVMESLGKEKDLNGQIVNQGIAVYGNKGTTDQHAYVQQLREGVNNFFVTFIEVLRDRDRQSIEVEPGLTCGDYLSAFLHGTRNALYEKGRESVTITIEKLDIESVGALIALYERAVGFYATLVNINAYHQPGVEAGKKMADTMINLQTNVLNHLKKNCDVGFTAEEIAHSINASDSVESIYKILEHASVNIDHKVIKKAGASTFDATYAICSP
ncbi:MAG TPA: glucose-6-phosphate isomerase [Nitrospirota bacterium]|nr:glucose-6-phosphate isomerase [Nitrospirota bacterium]